MKPLARVIDPEALERLEGARGRMRVDVPEGWAGGSVRIAVPRQLLCASCDGGGCDRCQRSGALRPPADGSLDVRLPGQIGEGVVVRIVHPFGTGGLVEVLLIEVRVGPASAACVLLASELPAVAPRPGRSADVLGLVALALVALAVVLVLALR